MPPASERDVDLRRFVEMSIDMLCIATADGHFAWVSPSWTRVLGWTDEELRSRPFIELVHPDDVEGTLAEYGDLLAGKTTTLHFRNRYRTKDGGWRLLAWNAVRDDDGRFHCNVRDMTGAADVELARQRQIEQLSLGEELAQVGHWLVDLTGGGPRWSPQTFRIHGLDPLRDEQPDLEAAIGFYHPDDRDRVNGCVGDAIAKCQPFEFTCRLIRADGAERLVHAIGRPQVDPRSGEVIAIFGVFMDITDREAELRRSNQELEQFASAAAHDLQAPLRTVVGLGELLREELGDQLSEDAEAYLERMMGGAERMRRLVGELFRFARAVRHDETVEAIDMDALMREVLQAVEADVTEAGAEVVVGPLPKARGRRSQVERVLQNLLQNALKFRRPDVPLRVEIESQHADGRTWYMVRDNGQGFEQRLATRMFGLFRQLDPQREGMGMGLALCKRIVEMHGGTIEALGRPGEGAAFRFTLPTAEA